ncbi:hypothetical protein PV328_006890 [Microctonus aethiopoides]|uniref:PPPDE domain-containing protein n=2 Tax=Braconidae TaxID=7402 RepID=A0AA39KU10_9HYME|nr:hypothetical protein PV328_006890 [Microctonus aethiopoides]
MEDIDEMGTKVELYVYDLTKGAAAMMSQILIGRHLDGVWHTAIVAYGREYFFGPSGIQSIRPGSTELGEPLRVEKIGDTFLPYSVFLEYINGLGTSKFAPGTYHLLRLNCNSFSDEVSNFLVGCGIPKYILDLPEEILKTPIGQALAPLIETLANSASAGFTVGQRFVEPRIQREVSPEYQLLNTAIEEARLNSIALEARRNELNEKLAKKERKKKKKKKEKRDKISRESGSESNSTGYSNSVSMADSEVAEMQPTNGDVAAEMLPSDRVLQMEADERREAEERKRQRDPPIVFKDSMDVAVEFEAFCNLLEGKLNDTERINLDELRQYVLENEGSWALGDNFLNFIGRILYDKSLVADVRVKLLNILAIAALKDDVILLLHQDRREHTIMNYAFDIDRHTVEEQLPLAQFMANMFENLSSSEWLLYISDWQHNNQNISNIRVTTKVAVHSLLSESSDLQVRGVAIIHNIACKEVKTVVFDDVVVELTMALLQYFNGNPSEEYLYASMKALARFAQISGQEVPQLIQMIGPEPNKFRGVSKRVDEMIDESCINHRNIVSEFITTDNQMSSKDTLENGNHVEEIVGKKKLRVQYLIERHIPIVKWLPKYSRFYAISDIIAGITLGLTMIPQSIAYAALAGLTPQYGLYSSYIGGFIYVLFGTIKEVSIGATSLMSLVTIEYTRDMPVDFVVLLTFLAGCVELTMGIMNLGFLVDFISIPVTSGFTSATSIIIIISQLPGLVGLRIRSESMVDRIRQLQITNGMPAITDNTSFLLQKLKDIDCSWVKHKNLRVGCFLEKTLWFLSISRNAIIVFIASSITYTYYQSGNSLFLTAGTVKPGVPKFKPPPFSTQFGNVTYTFKDMCSHLGTGIIIVPLVAVLTNVAIAKAFVRDGPVEATQEMLTLGMCNIAGGFVSSMPTCGAFTRSAVGNASGIQTPMAGIYSGIMALLALSYLTPYFGFIPRATLSAVLMSAVIFLIDWKIIKVLWKGSKRDMFAACSTFFISLFVNVESGLLFGTFANALFLLYLSARPSIEVSTVLGDKYVIVMPEIGLFYPAVAYLSNKITQIARKEAKGIYPVVVDFQRLQGIDYTAAQGIEKLLNSFENKTQLLIFLNVNPSVISSISTMTAAKNFKPINNENDLAEILSETDKKSTKSLIMPTFKELTEKTILPERSSIDTIKNDYSTSEEQESLLINNVNNKELELTAINVNNK